MKQQLCDSLLVQYNNHFDEIYECLKLPMDDEDAFSENMEAVIDSRKYSVLDGRIRGKIDIFLAQIKDIDVLDDAEEVTKLVVNLLDKLRDAEKNDLIQDFNKLVECEMTMKIIHETLNSELKREREELKKSQKEDEIVEGELDYQQFVSNIKVVAESMLLKKMDKKIAKSLIRFNRKLEESQNDDDQCEKTLNLINFLNDIKGLRAVDTVLGSCIKWFENYFGFS